MTIQHESFFSFSQDPSVVQNARLYNYFAITYVYVFSHFSSKEQNLDFCS